MKSEPLSNSSVPKNANKVHLKHPTTTSHLTSRINPKFDAEHGQLLCRL